MAVVVVLEEKLLKELEEHRRKKVIPGDKFSTSLSMLQWTITSVEIML